MSPVSPKHPQFPSWDELTSIQTNDYAARLAAMSQAMSAQNAAGKQPTASQLLQMQQAQTKLMNAQSGSLGVMQGSSGASTPQVIPPMPPLPGRYPAAEPVTTWAQPINYDWRTTTISDGALVVALVMEDAPSGNSRLPAYITGVDPRAAIYYLRLLHSAVVMEYLPDSYPAMLMLDDAALRTALTKPPLDGYKFAGPIDQIVREISHLLTSPHAYAIRFRQNLSVALSAKGEVTHGYNFNDTRTVHYFEFTGEKDGTLRLTGEKASVPILSFSEQYPALCPRHSWSHQLERAMLRASIFPSSTWFAVGAAIEEAR